MLREGLEPLSHKLILPEPTEHSDPSWFWFLVTVKENAGFTREEIVNHLEANKIQTRMLFAGNLLKHPCFDDMRKSGQGYRVVGNLKTTDQIMNHTFWVGVYPGMNNNMIKHITKNIKTICL